MGVCGREAVDMVPVRRGAAPVEESRGREYERTRADGKQATAAVVNPSESGCERFGHLRVRTTPPGDHHHESVIKQLESAVRHDGQTCLPTDRPGLSGRDQAAIPACACFGPAQAKHLERAAVLEGAQTIIGEKDDERRAGWHDPNDIGRFCRSQGRAILG